MPTGCACVPNETEAVGFWPAALSCLNHVVRCTLRWIRAVTCFSCAFVGWGAENAKAEPANARTETNEASEAVKRVMTASGEWVEVRVAARQCSACATRPDTQLPR